MNLLFAVDRNFCSLLLDCLYSITLHGGAASYDAYILHSDLLPENEAYIRQNVDACVTCHFIPVPEELFAGFPETKRYPKQIYYRLAAPLLLPENLDRILYMDVDTVVINSLRSLYHDDFEGAWFMACTHTGDALTKLNKIRLGIDKDRDVPYINTGVMMLNLPLLREYLDISAIQEYAIEKQHVLMLPDQDILTALYGDKVKLIDTMIYNLSDRTYSLYNADPRNEDVDLDWVRQNSVIIHYFGKNKPWRDGYIGVLDVFYHELMESKSEQEAI